MKQTEYGCFVEVLYWKNGSESSPYTPPLKAQPHLQILEITHKMTLYLNKVGHLRDLPYFTKVLSHPVFSKYVFAHGNPDLVLADLSGILDH